MCNKFSSVYGFTYKDKIIELFAIVRNAGDLYRVRIIEKEYELRSGQYAIQFAYFYDLYIDRKIKKKGCPTLQMQGNITDLTLLI